MVLDVDVSDLQNKMHEANIKIDFFQLLSLTLFREKVKECSNLLQYYIIDHRYVDTHPQDILNAGEPEKILEISEFSMLRLNDIAEQRTLYSSVDDIVYAHDSDSEYDEPPENSNNFISILSMLVMISFKGSS